MRRRRGDVAGAVPAYLWTFDPQDWTGAEVDRWRAWHVARLAHFTAAPELWPDVVTLLVDSWAVRRELLTVDSSR